MSTADFFIGVAILCSAQTSKPAAWGGWLLAMVIALSERLAGR